MFNQLLLSDGKVARLLDCVANRYTISMVSLAHEF